MPISMYQASIPVCLQFLTALSALLDKASEHARAAGSDPAELVNARLAPDMFPLSRQVQIATDHAKGMAARLAGRDAPKYEDNETTVEALKARIAKTMDFVSAVEVAEIEGSAERQVSLTVGGKPMSFTGQRYLMHFALPNFFFHATTAYAILRSKGVALGKQDFMGAA